ncbi:hypothetical protein RJ639_042735 [Escallonia herrerae]|uniref:Apple domain-containing protein n=1 Tax=Escallonia herrerae TaxID=1293975 RepID=A0AA88WDL7_9ASTE|nr:hypothetical protein RJ639_042735 [Escallonia herrerae]
MLDNAQICTCLAGYKPKSSEDWNMLSWSGGCSREAPLNCAKGEGFMKFKGVKPPDLLQVWMNTSMTLKECEKKCLKNCSCTAYASSNPTGRKTGCLLWYGDLVDIIHNPDYRHLTLYVRVMASELGPEKKKRLMVAMITVSVFLVVLLAFSVLLKRRLQRKVDTGFKVPLWEAIRAEKQRNESAWQPGEFLIGKGTSWEATESAMDESKPKTHKYGRVSTVLQSQDQEGSRKKALASDESGTGDTLSFTEPKKSQEMNEKVAETPLMLATKYGCTEIVEEILRKYPQAVEHVDAEGHNILHVAIIKVFDVVERMGIPMTRLIRKIDDNGNSILHYDGIKAEDHGAEDMRSPAMLLQEDLLLFEATGEYVVMVRLLENK